MSTQEQSAVTRIPAAEGGAYAAEAAWETVDWRSHQSWHIVDGMPVNTIELGDGAPIVFVHGLSGCWQNWLEQLPALAADHRVVTFDLPGFGASPMPNEQITISGYARLVDALLAQLGIDAAAVVGNSMGGFIASELAIAFPQRVERLVLVSPAGISTFDEPHATAALPMLTRLDQLLLGGGAWLAAHSEAVARRPRLREATMSVVVRHPRWVPAALAAEQLRGAGKPGFLQGLRAVTEYDLRTRLPEVACPTLVVWGDDDRLITVRDADEFARLIPGSREVIFEDTGHLSMLERPGAFNALLRDFLAG